MSEETTDPETQKDASRPFFQRPPGECGIYLNVYDAKPVNPKSYGSEHFYIVDLMERLHAALVNARIDRLKGMFERAGLLQDAIPENVYPGIVLTVSFNNVQGLENLWGAHKADQLLPVLQEFFITPAVLDVIGARYIEIRSRMWDDEYEDCRKELTESRALLPKITLSTRETDKAMIRLAKSSQPTFAAKLMALRDELTAFERHISEFTVIIKNHIPINMQHIGSFNEFTVIMTQLNKTKLPADMQPLRDYVRLREMLHEILVDIETGVCHPLAQVHTAFESEKQQETKRRLTNRRAEMAGKLEADYDVSRMKHSEAQRRILNRDHGLFLGLVAVIYVGLDLAIELDQMFDEYMSGFEIKFKHACSDKASAGFKI